MSGKPRPCGCKGYRSCLLCEKEFNLLPFKEDPFTAESLAESVSCVHFNLNSGLSKILFLGHPFLCLLPIV